LTDIAAKGGFSNWLGGVKECRGEGIKVVGYASGSVFSWKERGRCHAANREGEALPGHIQIDTSTAAASRKGKKKADQTWFQEGE